MFIYFPLSYHLFEILKIFLFNNGNWIKDDKHIKSNLLRRRFVSFIKTMQSQQQKKQKRYLYSLSFTHTKRKHFCLNKNMNIKRVCLWSYLFKYDEMIEKKLVVLSFHEKKIIKEIQHIKHQSMIVFPCVWNYSFIFLFVCLFLQKKSLKWISFLWNMHYLLSEKIISEYHERICLFNEERKISMKRCDFPLKTFFFLSQWDLFCLLMNKALLIISKWKNEL